MLVPAEKASLLGSQFDSKQCREQFDRHTFVFRVSFLILTHMMVDSLGVCPLFLKMVADGCSKTKHNFSWANSGIVSGVFAIL